MKSGGVRTPIPPLGYATVLTGNGNETIRYYYFSSGQLNSLTFNLDSHTLHSKIVHQTLEIQACKVKIYRAPEASGFEKGPSHDCITAIFQSTCCRLHLSVFRFEKNKRLVDIALKNKYNKNVVRMIKSCHISKMSVHMCPFSSSLTLKMKCNARIDSAKE